MKLLLLLSNLIANLDNAYAFVSAGQNFVPALIRTETVGCALQTSHQPRYSHLKNHISFSPLKSTPNDAENTKSDEIDVKEDDRLYRVRLSRATGIEWGTDLSFSFVYIRDMDPSGAAMLSGVISKGDQICELRPVEKGGEVIPLIGSSFDIVMQSFAALGKTTREVDLVFFKGSKDELKALCAGQSSSKNEAGKIAITVIQNKGSKDEETKVIIADEGANIRQTLVDEGINVYQSVTRWTNCKGKQLCGTCIINVKEGSENTNRKSMDEESTLRENPDSYRLSCVTFAYDDVTVETFPPIKAAQWTR